MSQNKSVGSAISEYFPVLGAFFANVVIPHVPLACMDLISARIFDFDQFLMDVAMLPPISVGALTNGAVI